MTQSSSQVYQDRMNCSQFQPRPAQRQVLVRRTVHVLVERQLMYSSKPDVLSEGGGFLLDPLSVALATFDYWMLSHIVFALEIFWTTVNESSSPALGNIVEAQPGHWFSFSLPNRTSRQNFCRHRALPDHILIDLWFSCPPLPESTDRPITFIKSRQNGYRNEVILELVRRGLLDQRTLFGPLYSVLGWTGCPVIVTYATPFEETKWQIRRHGSVFKG